MFNRAIEMKIIKSEKKSKDQTVIREGETVPVKLIYVSSAMDRFATQVAKGIVLYMLMDTFRQIMVEKAKKA